MSPGLENAQPASVSMCRAFDHVLPPSFEIALDSGVRLPKCDAHFGSYLLPFQISSRSPVFGTVHSSGHDSGASTPSDMAFDHVKNIKPALLTVGG